DHHRFRWIIIAYVETYFGISDHLPLFPDPNKRIAGHFSFFAVLFLILVRLTHAHVCVSSFHNQIAAVVATTTTSAFDNDCYVVWWRLCPTGSLGLSPSGLRPESGAQHRKEWQVVSGGQRPPAHQTAQPRP